MSESRHNKAQVRILTVDEGSTGRRIDNFLIGQLKGVPRSLVYRILRRGEVRVNKGRIKAGYRLKRGDLVRIPPVRVSETQISRPGNGVIDRLQQAVLFEDERFLVLNKPSGVAVHGGSGLNFGVIEALRVATPDNRQLELVHRLDRETSGCLLIAKKRSALRVLHELLRTNRVQKRYLALLVGTWDCNRMDVNEPLLKNTLKSGERMVQVNPNGKPARTLFRVLERFENMMLVEAQLLTGRTHQIRVHAAHLGTPIVGDGKYGDVAANRGARSLGLKRLFLHAGSLRFSWPGESDDLKFEAPLESSLDRSLERLREGT